MQQNIIKKLKGAMGADFAALLMHFKGAVFATSEASMRAKWDLVMQVRHVTCLAFLVFTC
jgi:hypothetical protein